MKANTRLTSIARSFGERVKSRLNRASKLLKSVGKGGECEYLSITTCSRCQCCYCRNKAVL